MVLCVKVGLKDAQKMKTFLSGNALFEEGYSSKRVGSSLFFPINSSARSKISSKFKSASFEEVAIVKHLKAKNLKDRLSGTLSKEEMALLKSAFDTVGTIAILEIPPELVKREKAIAEALLKLNTNIKTVLKKAGIHGTEFRTQKMQHLAGVKTKETLHKELGLLLKLDVETVYFSPRLGTERKRIAGLVKEGEDILVMFSGCAPYPCVLSKHTKAKDIVGIELNPEGHRYGLENLRINRCHNVVLINGDVAKIVPNIYQHCVGLKTAIDWYEFERRLEYKPELMEIHLESDDLFVKPELVEERIQELQAKGIQVSIHVPFTHDGKGYSLCNRDIHSEVRMLRMMGNICKKYDIKGVVHPTSNIAEPDDEARLIKNLRIFCEYFDYFHFENLTHGVFMKAKDIVRIGKKAGIKNVCIDLVHLYLAYGDNAKIESDIKLLKENFGTYFHIADHDKKTHSCQLGKGFIDFRRMLPHVNRGVVEVWNTHEPDPVEMVNSLKLLGGIARKFDRILMPLPKSAEDFLDAALLSSKKGTVIHFYDFLSEQDFPKAHEKIKKACARNKMKFKILDTVKCGHHAPRVFRVCVDFEIL